MPKMPPSFAEIIRSEQSTFLIGKDKHPVVVHAAAIASTSAPLNCLINGPMVEGQTKCAEFPDLEVEDFVRFCEWAYRGDYATPCGELDVEEGDGQAGAEAAPAAAGDLTLVSGKKRRQDESDGWGTDLPVKDKKPRVSRGKLTKEEFRYNFDYRKYYCNEPCPKRVINRSFKVIINTQPNQSFSPVFLAHARLYVFASIHLVERLKTSILRKLHTTLVGFNLHNNDRRIQDVVDLAQYVYSSDDLIPDDEIRRMVVEYFVREVEVVGKSKPFNALLEDGACLSSISGG